MLRVEKECNFRTAKENLSENKPVDLCFRYNYSKVVLKD